MSQRKRLEFPIATKRQALERSRGICECHRIPHVFKVFCGRPLGTANTFFEHVDPDQLRPDNSVENCAVLVRTCWRFKTDTYDLPVIAKAKRGFDAHHGIRRPGFKLPGGRLGHLKKTLNRGVVIRATGERA